MKAWWSSEVRYSGEVRQDRARALGVFSQDVAQTLQAHEVGGTIEESARNENALKAVMPLTIVATVLTLLFLPALYAAWYRVAEPPRA